MKTSMLLGATAASALLWPYLALAQATASSNPPSEAVAQSTNLQEVVVTAQRRSANLQTVPAAVVAISKTEIEQAGVQSATDLTRITPGLNFAQSSFDTQPTIRGIGSRATGPGDESNVAVYVDGVYQTDMPDLNFNLSNVQNVQVLEGPQGALYGRNATGGAIIVELTKPSFTPIADFTASYGTYNHAEIDARVSGPITSTLAGEVDVAASREDGYIRDIVEDRDVGGENDINLRVALLYKPTSRLSVQINAHYSNRICETCALSGVYSGIAQLQTTAPDTPIASAPWQTAEELHPSFKFLSEGGDIHLNYDFGPVLATLTTSYTDNQTKIQFDNDLGEPNFEYVDSIFKTEAYIGDLQFTSEVPGRFQWTAGLNEFYDVARGPILINTDSFAATNIYNNPGCEALIPVAPTCNIIGIHQGAVIGNAILNINSTQITTAFAAYVDGTYNIIGGLYLNAGVRYTTETHNFKDSLIFDGFLAETGSGSKTWTNFSPHGAIRYEFPDKTNVYFSVSTGFKSGLFNGAARPPPNSVNPETVTAYELGVKTEIAHTIRIDASVFDEQYSNLQVQQSVSAAEILLENAATARIRGADLNVLWSPSQSFDARLGVAVLDAKFTSFPNASVEIPSIGASAVPNGFLGETAGVGPIAGGQPFVPSVAGNWLIRTPPWTIDVGANYHWPLFNGRLTLSGDFYSSGSFYWDVANLFKQGNYNLLSASVTWASNDHRWRLSISGENLTDAAVTDSMVLSANGAAVNYMHPLSVIGSISYNFF